MKSRQTQRIALMGDVMLGRLVNDALRDEVPDYPWGDVLSRLHQCDCRICNLECVLSDIESTAECPPKAFHFRSDARNVAVLKAAGIDAVSLANNHTLDFGIDAMSEMLRVLDNEGIAHTGAGKDFMEASQPTIGKFGGTRVGLISFTDNEPEWEALAKQPGVFYIPVDQMDERCDALLDLVGTARHQSDILIVAAHWGPNWGYTPLPQHVDLAHQLIDAGADVIFGHSPHVCRGVEIYRERPILYSTGDFIDDYAIDPMERNDRSFLFIVEIADGRFTQVLLVPTLIERFQALLAKENDLQEITSKMMQLCAELGTPVLWDESEGCLSCEIHGAGPMHSH